jgi:hypothetical protein
MNKILLELASDMDMFVLPSAGLSLTFESMKIECDWDALDTPDQNSIRFAVSTGRVRGQLPETPLPVAAMPPAPIKTPDISLLAPAPTPEVLRKDFVQSRKQKQEQRQEELVVLLQSGVQVVKKAILSITDMRDLAYLKEVESRGKKRKVVLAQILDCCAKLERQVASSVVAQEGDAGGQEEDFNVISMGMDGKVNLELADDEDVPYAIIEKDSEEVKVMYVPTNTSDE